MVNPRLSNAYKRRAQAGVALGDKESLETAVRDYSKVRALCKGPLRSQPAALALYSLHCTHLDPLLLLQAVELGDKECAGPLREAKAALKKARRKDFYAVCGGEGG